MPVQIGASSPSFADPIGLLSDCHRRIEMFLRALHAVAETADHPLTDDARKSLETALRYFREAAPKHTADEEESLFPRLRWLEDAEARLDLARLEALEADHRDVVTLHATMDKLGMRYLQTDAMLPSEAEEFRAAIAGLITTYSLHILVEDSIVFPVAAQLLSEADKNAVGKEMAARRNVRPIQIELQERPHK